MAFTHSIKGFIRHAFILAESFNRTQPPAFEQLLNDWVRSKQAKYPDAHERAVREYATIVYGETLAEYERRQSRLRKLEPEVSSPPYDTASAMSSPVITRSVEASVHGLILKTLSEYADPENPSSLQALLEEWRLRWGHRFRGYETTQLRAYAAEVFQEVLDKVRASRQLGLSRLGSRHSAWGSACAPIWRRPCCTAPTSSSWTSRPSGWSVLNAEKCIRLMSFIRFPERVG